MIEVAGKSTKLSEEIVRWKFELDANIEGIRYIAFTNPTAGPWKTVNGPVWEERYTLHSFGKKEPRPDVILVCDRLKQIYVIEAKDSAKKLDKETIEKTYEISETFRRRFSTYTAHASWQNRLTYSLITGFIFGSTIAKYEDEANALLDRINQLGYNNVSEPYICATVDDGKELTLKEFAQDHCKLF